jgi:hypothetical protein
LFGGGKDGDKDKDKDKGKGKNGNDESDEENARNGNRQAPGRDANAGDDEDGKFDADGYQKWDFPWSLSVNYSIGYAYGTFNYDKMEYNSKITQNLSFSGTIRPTNNWNFGFSASYNFDTHRLAYMNCNVTRDLHCFSMRASFVPVGTYKSYSFSIAVKSSMLSDLKYDKRSSLSNGVTWY